MSKRNDQQLEMLALQAILAHGDEDEMLRLLVPEDFVEKAHRSVYEACLAVAAAGMAVGYDTVCSHLNGVRWWDDIGGSSWLAGLLSSFLPYKTPEGIASALRRLTILRLQEDVTLQEGDVTQNLAALEKARDRMLGLLPTQVKRAADFKSQIGVLKDRGVPTGFAGIDDLLGGMLPGHFIVVGAYTGVGKSIFLMNVAAAVATRELRVLWIGLEMSEVEVLERFCKLLDVEGRADAIDHLPNMYIVAGSWSPSQIEAEVLRGKYDLVILDYIQLVRSEGKFQSEVQRLEDLTRRLKQLAVQAKTVLVAAAQINRNAIQNNRAPRLSDLRGSGSIEQDANAVILLHRDEGEDDPFDAVKKPLGTRTFQSNPKGDTIVSLEKNRGGREGMIRMQFDRKRLRFVDPGIAEPPSLGV